MKNILYLGALAAVLITAGCSSMDEMPQIKEEPQEMLAPGHVPRSVSCNILNKVLVKANFKTSGGVANITCMANENDCRAYNAAGEQLTRADEEEARFYVFDIGTEGDYAIMGANTSVPPLLVLASGDSQTDPNGPDEFKRAITNLPYDLTPLDSLGTGPGVTKPTEYVKYYDYLHAEYKLVGGKEPIKLKWGPHDPWNTLNDTIIDHPYGVTHCANNCSCIAMAMILTNEHYRPVSYQDYIFPDWNLVSAYEYPGIENQNPELEGGLEKVVELIHFLSRADLMGVNDWNDYVSWNPTYRIPLTYKALGYEVKNMSFSLDTLISSIVQGYPIFAGGYKIPEKPTDDSNGHSWVMSAVVEANVPWCLVETINPVIPDEPVYCNYESQYLVHHNFGWAGQGQGYYLVASKIRTGRDVKISEDFGVLNETMRKGWGTYGSLHMYIDKRVNLNN